ncbi:MAG TPA: aminotransferase class I/II-fold pyridoxal phosphate-dependent enzyme [Acidimicrobiales bacterium]|nr:aminotransferase class I/II-fold pyridoxal phosphate-dependent enzyme [Acidimicrobiales bacterium]
MSASSVLPPYPHSTLGELHELAKQHGEVIDLSIGTPCDPPPAKVLEILGSSGAERGYPPSPGTARFREAAAAWMERRFSVAVEAANVAACVGTKELVAGLPSWLRLLRPERALVLHPKLAYPSYAMGAFLAGAEATPFSDQTSALCRWVNSPSNPTGELDDLEGAARWATGNDTPVLSDECYAELTWDGPPRTILEHGGDSVLAVHSLSKRSNLAGLRAGFFTGDAVLMEHLVEVRRHAGLMVPGPVQEAAAAALDDDDHAATQADRYRSRLERCAAALRDWGLSDAPLPAGGIYLWVQSPDGDGWNLARRLAEQAGAVVAPGSLYGEAGAAHVRIAMTTPDAKLDLVLSRLALSSF